MSNQRIIPWLRLATLVALCLPAVDLAWRWYAGDLDPRPVTLATHATGDWSVALLLVSLALTPARAIFDWMPLIHIRRRVGVAAALYAVAHLLIYVLDQKWDLVVVATEIVKRFYLTIGFVALLALVALAVTSTNGWQKRLKRNWKRLHWLVYPAVALAILHFFIQSKVKIGEAAFAAGLFAWLMLWRLLPVRLRASFAGLFLLAAGATLITVAFEASWVRAGEQDRSDARAGRQSRSRAGAAAGAEGAGRLAAGNRAGGTSARPRRGDPALDAALYPADYTDFLTGKRA